MRRRMNGAEISQLRKKGRVGILNACIRLKMATATASALSWKAKKMSARP